jgi:FkbM family methyltransferase
MGNMLVKLDKIVKEYDLKIHGVLHIGAHYGQEYKAYAKQGIKNMIFFEPVKANFKELIHRMPSGTRAFNVALGNEVGGREIYLDIYKGQSCSLLEPGTHLELHPKVKFTGKEMVPITKLDLVKFDRKLFNMINIDVQGFELEVFKGAIETLKSIDIIYTEVNFEEVYKGCCLIEVLDEFLCGFGFIRVLTKDSNVNKDRFTWGDALYLKK